MQDGGVFEMLTLAQELGVEDLQNNCEEHVTSTMSVLNACTFLAAAMDIQDRTSSKYTFNIFYDFTMCFHKILYTDGKCICISGEAVNRKSKLYLTH